MLDFIVENRSYLLVIAVFAFIGLYCVFSSRRYKKSLKIIKKYMKVTTQLKNKIVLNTIEDEYDTITLNLLIRVMQEVEDELDVDNGILVNNLLNRRLNELLDKRLERKKVSNEIYLMIKKEYEHIYMKYHKKNK